MKVPRGKKNRKPTTKKDLTAFVKQVVQGQVEPKVVAFYEQYNDGGSALRPLDGTYSRRGFSSQNQQISGNNTDIKQLIPYVAPGTSDNQRIGSAITPTKLIVKGHIRVSNEIKTSDPPFSGPLITFEPTDIKVCIYVLQHVTYKDYDTLFSQNDFTQLLSTSENNTGPFQGQVWQGDMPVAKQYYRLIKKKMITLRYAGLANVTGPVTNSPIANAHNYYASYTMDLSKHLPATLKYPETNVTGNTGNSPTNSSLFMCMGWVDQNEPGNGGGGATPNRADLQETYTSYMTFKDL